jgi:ketosteroid isomerase-like protein
MIKQKRMFTEKELLEYSLRWDKAIETNDTDEISRYMAEDWVYVATLGGIILKRDFLGRIRTGELVHTAMSTEESRVKIYGTTGIVTGKGYSKGFFRGEPFSFYEWSTSVFVAENNEWKCVLTMLTPA